MRELLGLPTDNKYRIGAIALLAIMGVSIVAGIVVLLFASLAPISWIIEIFVLTALLLCAIGLLILVFIGRTEARIERILAGDYWTAWRYTDDEQRAMPEEWQRQMNAVYIGPLGVCWSGGQRPRLDDFGNGLLDVQVRAETPSILRFSYQEDRRSASETDERSDSIFDLLIMIADLIQWFAPNKITREILVPIPPDHEAEAEELVKRFRSGHLGIPSPSKRDVRLTTWATFGTIILFVLAVVLMVPALTARSARLFPTPTPTLDLPATAYWNTVNERLSAIKTQISDQISAWEKSASSDLTRLNAAEARLTADTGIKEIDYGLCKGNNFFLYVLDNTPSSSRSYSASDTTGFAFVRQATPRDCAPRYWVMDRVEPMGEGWYRVEMRTYGATLVPTLTAMARARQTLDRSPTVPPQ